MSSTESRRTAPRVSPYQEKTEAALASIARDRERREGPGAAVMTAAMSFGEAVESGPLAKAVKISQAICIIFAGVAPVALFWAHVYPG